MRYELTHTKVIDLVGAARLADILKLPKSTVYSWRQAGIIPAKHHPSVMEAARKLGIAITPNDFIGVIDVRRGTPARSDAHV